MSDGMITVHAWYHIMHDQMIFVLCNDLVFYKKLLHYSVSLKLSCTRCDQKIVVIFLKSIYLFINNCFDPFKVTPLSYNTLMPAFFPILETLLKHAFWYRQQLLFWFFFYLLNYSKTLSFHRYLQFREEEKVSGCQDPCIRWLRHDYVFVLAKNSRTSIVEWAGALSWCKIMLQT